MSLLNERTKFSRNNYSIIHNLPVPEGVALPSRTKKATKIKYSIELMGVGFQPKQIINQQDSDVAK